MNLVVGIIVYLLSNKGIYTQKFLFAISSFGSDDKYDLFACVYFGRELHNDFSVGLQF